jgi:hypothetical protein
MEYIRKAYSMLLGKPWLRQTKAHHDWGNNTLTIIVDIIIMTLNTKKRIMVHPSQRPCNLDDTYDWEGGLMDGDKACLYHVVPELWLFGEVSIEEFKLLLEVYVGMAQLEENIHYPLWYYQHELRETLILDEFVDIMIKNKQITR